MPRALSQLAKAAGQWIADARSHFGWTEEDLVDRIERLFGHFRTVRVPTIEEVQALEAGRVQHLPAWVKFARLAVEREEMSTEAERVRWAEERSPWQSDVPHDEFDCCWPLVTRPEFHLLEHLDAMREEDRRMAFRLAAAWNSPYAARNKVFEAVIEALSARMHVTPEPRLPAPVQRLKPELARLLYKFKDGDVALLEFYLGCDQEGRRAIAKTALREGNRIMGRPADEPF